MRANIPALFIGSTLSLGGLAHIWMHSEWGTTDWGVIAVIALGLGICFNRQVVRTLYAMRGIKTPTTEEKIP